MRASLKDQLREVRFHGRNGQGVVTAAKLLAEAAMKEGKYFQFLPDYGGERMGTPVRAYTRSFSTVRLQSWTPWSSLTRL